MNPDGFALKRRGNANDVDLNRDFPDQVPFCNFPSTSVVMETNLNHNCKCFYIYV